ncbi:peptide ABC transporter substrate-binding protein [Bremerella cremea]|uniref:Peptide ABC transporter substrate-binding protein n=1 Tax=Bremerella cremea TaxID=1031537 RepID=A0A368KWP1_9BACT|nr:peptide ABC transporter substrate-binding protein [Bremerella cremea]RCS54853.1 peptide ABC transporter substrate-binding protein [Bremerella cremea]
MKLTLRGLFPYLFPLIFVVALLLALQMGSLPPADFTFSNGTEPQSVDPAKATGAPEGRILDAIFEGLYRKLPDPEDPYKMKPMPGMAISHDLSDDKRIYTFHMRPGAKWTNGEPVTAYDWTFSWMRFLHPESASQYAYQLWYIKNAKRYTTMEVNVGDKVEVELTDRPNSAQLFPRGTIVSGIVTKIDEKTIEPEEKKKDGEEGKEEKKTYKFYHVDCVPDVAGEPDWNAGATKRVFYLKKTPDKLVAEYANSESAHNVLLHFSEVGIKAPDEMTLVVELDYPTPYFLDLAAFYPMHAVNRTCIEKYGYPNWTKPENIVTSGPYKIQTRRIRDRIRLVKNPDYYNADTVKLDVIDVLAIQSDTTQLNMFMSGQLDWATTVPSTVIPELEELDDKKQEEPRYKGLRKDLLLKPMLATYFYRVNTQRPPLDNPKVRQALDLAINKQEIVDHVTRAGQVPANSLVPPGLPDYTGPEAPGYDPERARQLLAEAGFPDGKGMRKIQILYNTLESHRAIAEVIQQQWKSNLHIDVELRNVEWGVYLTTMREMDYDVVRAGWIGDYPDPNTFLDMFVTDGENNQTGWSNKEYDELIHSAIQEPDVDKRRQMLYDAEKILNEERPILPIYYNVSLNMVRPYVKNFYPNLQDLHPLQILEIDKELREKIREWEDLK